MIDEIARLRRLGAVLIGASSEFSLPELATLLVIAAEPGLSVNDLAERIQSPQQTASRLASVLMGRYQDPFDKKRPNLLVEQRISDSDPRKRALFLTQAGQEIISRIIAILFKPEV